MNRIELTTRARIAEDESLIAVVDQISRNRCQIFYCTCLTTNLFTAAMHMPASPS